jgi:hypothetical protein
LLEDRVVGPAIGLFQPERNVGRGIAVEQLGQELDGQLARLLSSLIPAHAIGYGEQIPGTAIGCGQRDRLDKDCVLIAGPARGSGRAANGKAKVRWYETHTSTPV